MPFKHGQSCGSGLTPEYRAWQLMLRRTDPDSRQAADYYSRGIRVCSEWRTDFVSFLRDVGKKPTPDHSLDRIDNDGNYEPGNVRWATRAEQRRNSCDLSRQDPVLKGLGAGDGR